jgi:NDP-sugar pyrophosphorylase family protein
MSLSQPDSRAAASLASIDVAVLAGGLGTRLRSVLGETPKILAPIGGRPYVDHLLSWLAGFGTKRVVLCLGFRAELVIEHLKRHPFPGIEVVTSIETQPLGTAGGLRLAVPQLQSDTVLVMNGDTFVDADLPAFVAAHKQAGGGASVLCAEVPSTARYGRLDVDGGKIRRFREKDPSDIGPGVINAGIYAFARSWLRQLARGTATSLERDVFAAAPAGTFNAIPAGNVAFVDIGTPESYAEAETVISGALGRSAAGTARNPVARSVA